MKKSSEVNKYVSIFKDAFSFLANASVYSIIKVLCFATITITLSLSAIMAYKAVTSEQFIAAIAHKVNEEQDKEETKNLDIRDDKVTPKIQKEIEMLCYTLDADRVFIFEMHNGKRNTTGLPFRYADMSYEEVNSDRKVERIAKNYQNVPLTLYKFPHYVAEHNYVFGNLEDVTRIDTGFAEEISDSGGKYLAVIYVISDGTPLGFICVAFHDTPKFKEEYIKSLIESHEKVIRPLLDLRMQIYWNK